MTNQDRLLKIGGIIISTLALLVICIATYSAIKNGSFNNTPTATTIPFTEIVIDPSSTPTLTPDSTLNFIPTFTPIPILPTLVEEIDVLAWNISPTCKAGKAIGVHITGAVIAGGVPPYWIEGTFIDSTTTPRRKAVPTNSVSPYKVIIKPPLIVNTDKWITVTIRSDTANREPDWTHKLYFPSTSPDCDEKEKE